jgi:phosphatidylserine/phosphatidylglycerophosphate/cardiolipin synthase-like enzyme
MAALACAAAWTAAPAACEMAQVEAAFTPGDNIAAMIIQRIGEAHQSVRMQAYLFTDRRIADALVAARRRGVRVEVIVDAAQREGGGAPHLAALQRAGARIFVDGSAAAAHNKILIIDADGRHPSVITGSYNYTRAANARNAENVVIISGSPGVASRFVGNFEYHRAQSTPWP